MVLLPQNSIIEVVIIGNDEGVRLVSSLFHSPFQISIQHPIHLHGHAFDVIRSSGSNVTNYKNVSCLPIVCLAIHTPDNPTTGSRLDGLLTFLRLI